MYEIGDPSRYLLPDVACDWTQVRVTQVGPHRVHVEGARGAAPSPLCGNFPFLPPFLPPTFLIISSAFPACPMCGEWDSACVVLRCFYACLPLQLQNRDHHYARLQDDGGAAHHRRRRCAQGIGSGRGPHQALPGQSQAVGNGQFHANARGGTRSTAQQALSAFFSISFFTS